LTHLFYPDEAPDTADDSDEDLITSYIPGVGIGHPVGNTSGHPIIRIGSPTTGNTVLPDNRPILGKYTTLCMCKYNWYRHYFNLSSILKSNFVI